MSDMPRATRGHGLLEGFLARQRVAQANRLIPESARNGRVLDIGCGSHPMFLLETEFAEKFGLDRVPSALREDGIRIQHNDVTANAKLPFDDGYFDVVTMLAVFEHLDRSTMARLVEEIHRVLRPGGCYVLTTPAAWTNPILQALSRLGLVSEEEIDEHEPLYGLPEIRSILINAGFDNLPVSTGYFELGLNTWARAVK